jgi:hypothetical protein
VEVAVKSAAVLAVVKVQTKVLAQAMVKGCA